MSHEHRPRARGLVALVACGFLASACSAGAGATASVPAASTSATPAAAPAASGTPGDAASPGVTASAPASVPAGTSRLRATAPPTSVPSATTGTAASAPPTVIAAQPTRTPPPPSPASTAVTVQLGEPDNGKSIAVTVGSQVTLVLHNTYWQVQGSSDPAVLAMVTGPVTTGAGPIACIPGTGCGTVTAVFRAATPGTATVSASRTSCGEALRCVGGAGSFEIKVVVVP